MSSHRIKSVDIIPIFPRLASRYADRVVDMYGIDSRLLCRIETDSGLVGWGDQRVRPRFVPADDMGQDLVGRDPFDEPRSVRVCAGGEPAAVRAGVWECEAGAFGERLV